MLKILGAVLGLAAVILDAGGFGAAGEFITLGTGSIGGTYYPTGSAICRTLNQHHSGAGLRCSVEATRGSVENIEAIRKGKLDFAIVQSDSAYEAYHGQGRFRGKAVKGLRSVMALYPELLTLVVRRDAGIHKLTDIRGKRIDLGAPGSGTRMTVTALLKAFGIKRRDLAKAGEIGSAQGPTLLKDGKYDGYFGVFGHPAPNIEDAANLVKIDLIPITGKPVKRLIDRHPYYVHGVIPGSLYRGVRHPTPTLGVEALLVTSDKLPDAVVYALTKTLLDNLGRLKKLHPVFHDLSERSLLKGLAIPQHPGAIKAFKEAGILK
jgi:TRAP transporter TAXI family solute receptor